MASKEYEGIKSVAPNISGSLTFRDKANGYCVEQFSVD